VQIAAAVAAGLEGVGGKFETGGLERAVVVHGVEAYVGYEYRDIDRFWFNGLVGGVGVWF
jgi:hypothetical protein